jgi:phosphatidylserine/phosphatidylglycerophosphate/cardiolipin synthase-like enzyme
MTNKAAPTAAVIDRIIRRNLGKLARPGVLTVRPGFEITNHQLTGRVAIVATVHTKTRDLPTADRLPNSLEGIRVDVREATPQQRLRASDPAAASLTQAFGRPENAAPQWSYERELPGGRLLTSSKSRQQTALAEYGSTQLAKPQIPYVPAPGQPLAPMTLTTTITACVSPDAGFATLTAFLGATQKSLVVGMYDFTSGPLLREFVNVLTGAKTLQLVLDNPAPNPTRNQTDSQTVAALEAALKSRARIVRALTKSDVLVTAWIFPSAYHIKVIVRDNSALWLSSGNLNNSNEPDPASPPATEDRDWHVIIESPALAALFTAYLDQDFASAKAHQASAASAAPASAASTSAASASGETIADAAAKLAAATNPLPPRRNALTPPAVTAASTFNNVPVTITPLLTPDNLASDPSQGQYLATMLALIGKARKSLYIQLQYIESSTTTGDYAELLQAIAARIKAGVDVRLIESLEYGEQWAEKMKSAGVDLTANIALQPNVHNKGFVIDSAIVVVSSQNFSPEGVRLNRDAGVIIENASIAQYFEKVFLSDWTTRAKPFAPQTAARGRRPAAKAVKR